MRSTVSRLAFSSLAPVLILLAVASAKEESWRHNSASDFNKAEKDQIIISDSGTVRLSHAIEKAGDLQADRVWSLARSKDGTLYAATGDEGRVFRREGDGDWKLLYDADDTQALSLAALPDGRVFVGTGPSGQVVELTAETHPASRPGPDVKYIWSLAAGPDGILYAATGPTGQLWNRPASGDWKLVFDSPQKHLLCVSVDKDGSIYTGSDGEGLIYRIDAEGKVSILYDAPQDEVHTLAIGPDGVLHAGTATGGPESPSRGSPRGLSTGDLDEHVSPQRRLAATSPIRHASRFVQDRPRSTDSGPAGTARPKAAPPGENAVYRIEADGSAREIFRARALIYALAWQGDRLLVGTGPDGELHEIRGAGRDSAAVAKVDHGQILALLAGPEGDIFLGVGDPGGVLRLTAGYARSGSLTSDVLDAKLVSRFGNLQWHAEQPAGTSVSVQLRTGNVGQPDDTWSDWSAPLTDPDASGADVPPGRFAQYRVTLQTDDPAKTPEFQGLAWYYRTRNLPPEIARITVPDLTAADGAARKTKLDLKWDASDPNDDDLVYSLAIHKEGWPDWVELEVPAPLTEESYSWDTTAFPEGVYRLRLSASDRPSNPPGEALTSRLSSDAFVVDHRAPGVSLEVQGRTVRVLLSDDLTRLVKAEYALDGADWVPVFPEDGLFDARRETVLIRLPALKAGAHVLMVRATDAAGNVGSGDAVLNQP